MIVVRKLKGEDRLEITLHEVVADMDHTMDEDAARLEKDGVERDLQELLADAPGWCGEGFRLVRREWPTDIGPVDLMCRDERGRLDRGRDQADRDDRRRRAARPATSSGSGWTRRWPTAAACWPRRSSSRRRACWPRRAGCAWVEVDLAELRGEREPALTLFGS